MDAEKKRQDDADLRAASLLSNVERQTTIQELAVQQQKDFTNNLLQILAPTTTPPTEDKETKAKIMQLEQDMKELKENQVNTQTGIDKLLNKFNL